MQEKLVCAMLSRGMFYPSPQHHHGGNGRPLPIGFPPPPQPSAGPFEGLISLPPPSSHYSSTPSYMAPFPPHHPVSVGAVRSVPAAPIPPPATIPIFGHPFTSGSSPISSAAFPVTHLTPPPSRGGMAATALGCGNVDEVTGRLPVMTSSVGESYAMAINGQSPTTSE